MSFRGLIAVQRKEKTFSLIASPRSLNDHLRSCVSNLQNFTLSFVIPDGAVLSLTNRGQYHRIYFYLLQCELGLGTYILECSVDCLRDAPDVVVAGFLWILWKQQLTNFLIAGFISIIPAGGRMRRRSLWGCSDVTSWFSFRTWQKFQIAPWRQVLRDRFSHTPTEKKKGKKAIKRNVGTRVRALRYPRTDLYILHLRLDGSAECLKLGCNHADRCNRRIHSYCDSVSSVRRAPPAGIHRDLKDANADFRSD